MLSNLLGTRHCEVPGSAIRTTIFFFNCTARDLGCVQRVERAHVGEHL